jgi:hypothetical protein
MFTTSYLENGFKDIMQGLVKLYNPKTIVELGTQQGASAVVIGEAMSKDSKLFTFDLFKEKYDKPPYCETKADFLTACDNVGSIKPKKHIEVFGDDAYSAIGYFQSTIDMLHLDLCNYYDNVKPILAQWKDKVEKLIVLEGGTHNSWQKNYGFKPFFPMLDEPWLANFYDHVVLTNGSDYAMTVMVRK